MADINLTPIAELNNGIAGNPTLISSDSMHYARKSITTAEQFRTFVKVAKKRNSIYDSITKQEMQWGMQTCTPGEVGAAFTGVSLTECLEGPGGVEFLLFLSKDRETIPPLFGDTATNILANDTGNLLREGLKTGTNVAISLVMTMCHPWEDVLTQGTTAGDLLEACGRDFSAAISIMENNAGRDGTDGWLGLVLAYATHSKDKEALDALTVPTVSKNTKILDVAVEILEGVDYSTETAVQEIYKTLASHDINGGRYEYIFSNVPSEEYAQALENLIGIRLPVVPAGEGPTPVQDDLTLYMGKSSLGDVFPVHWEEFYSTYITKVHQQYGVSDALDELMRIVAKHTKAGQVIFLGDFHEVAKELMVQDLHTAVEMFRKYFTAGMNMRLLELFDLFDCRGEFGAWLEKEADVDDIRNKGTFEGDIAGAYLEYLSTSKDGGYEMYVNEAVRIFWGEPDEFRAWKKGEQPSLLDNPSVALKNGLEFTLQCLKLEHPDHHAGLGSGVNLGEAEREVLVEALKTLQVNNSIFRRRQVMRLLHDQHLVPATEAARVLISSLPNHVTLGDIIELVNYEQSPEVKNMVR